MNERARQGRKKIFPAGTARALGGSLARREYLFPHPAYFASTNLLLGREISLFSGLIRHKVLFPLYRPLLSVYASGEKAISEGGRAFLCRMSFYL